MIPTPHITEHALLRWMERVHGADVTAWRSLMEADLRGALDAYSGDPAEAAGSRVGAFILSGCGDRFVTVIGPDQVPTHRHTRTIAVARVHP